MSAIGGVYNFNGAPIDEGLLIELGNHLRGRGPDGGGEVLFQSIGMTYRAFHTNRQSKLENQPLVSPGRQMLVWDGRLDNREELISELRNDLRDDRTDVALVMAAYCRWEADCLPRLVGDFALSLWEPQTRTLLLARDPVGTRTLYYHADNSRIIWSTELGPLLELSGIQLQIDDEYIAEFLTRFPAPSQTPYKNIFAVPPAGVVAVRDGQLKVQRFWGLNPNYEIRYKTDNEYEDHFRHLFREAIACRLRVEGQVWAELSGGLDSSSIVCMADRMVKSGSVEASRLETVSLVFDEASQSDERNYIRCVENKIGKRGHHLREDDFRMLVPSAVQHPSVIPNPFGTLAEYNKALNQLMHKNAARVLLSGRGGDEILNNSPDPTPELADLLVQWKVPLLHQRLKVWSKTLRKPYLRLLSKDVVVPALSQYLQLNVGRSRKMRILDLYDQRFVTNLNLRRRSVGVPDIFGFRYPSGRKQSISYLSVVRMLSAGYWREWGNIETTYPFMHRPLIEFMQAIPSTQRIRPNETRSLMRRAIRDLLPIEIVNRKDKTFDTDATLRAVSREWLRLRLTLADARVCTHGYISREVLLNTLNQAKKGSASDCLSIAFVISLENWLRQFERRCVTHRSLLDLGARYEGMAKAS